ncbi:MAG: T9SS type A sorting domain-containing protein, partial [Bacteroidota bacterium]
EPVHDMHMIDSLSLIGIVGDVDYGASMVKTKNGGERWDYTYLNIFGEPRALSFRTDAEAWSPLGFAGLLMYTRDTANTWTTLETPYRRPIYDLVFTDSSTGYAIGDSGMILKYSTSTVNVEENLLAAPISFALHQNYPNPFNPSTTISYDLPRESVVTLKVFNLLGEEVRTLVNQRKEAGRHLVNFDAEGLPSGVYLYRLQTETSTLSRKMLLLR